MKIIITESQYKRISEAIAGYDDFNMMATHGGKIMTHFFGFIKDLMQLFSGINEMIGFEEISDIDLKENLRAVVDVIDEITEAFKIGFKDFSEKNLIRSGMSLIKSLNRLKQKIQPLTIAGPAIVSNDQILNMLEKLSTNAVLKLKDFTEEHEKTHNRFMNILTKNQNRPKRDFN